MYAGQFTGGIDIRGYGQLLIAGQQFQHPAAPIDLAPPYSGKGMPANSEVTVTGLYRNGSPLSIVVRNGLDRPLRTAVFPSSPSAVLFYTPEPASASLFAFSLALPVAAPPARPLLVTHVANRVGPSGLTSPRLDSRRCEFSRPSARRSRFFPIVTCWRSRLGHFFVVSRRRRRISLCRFAAGCAIIAAAKGVAAPRPRGRITGLS